jgi:hypothetical protein
VDHGGQDEGFVVISKTVTESEQIDNHGREWNG